jgi:two-component system chemotaxis response regulator CheY
MCSQHLNIVADSRRLSASISASSRQSRPYPEVRSTLQVGNAREWEDGMQRRALVVDDEQNVCQLIGKVLNSAGIEALTLTRSTEASEILDEGVFDVVFLDLHMPSPDGIDLARQMRSSRFNRSTPIIMISDDQRPSALAIGFAAGASFFLYKPIDKDRLLKLVRATQGIMGHERRRTRRVPIQSKVRLLIGDEELQGVTIDVSMSGLLVRAPRIAPVGSSLRMSMQLSPRVRPIVADGAVIRVLGGNQMGIHLGHLTLPESERIQEFLLRSIPNE